METHCLWKSLESVSTERLVVMVTVTFLQLMLGSMARLWLWISLKLVSIEGLVVMVTVTYFELMLGSMDADMFVNIFGVEFRYLTAVS